MVQQFRNNNIDAKDKECARASKEFEDEELVSFNEDPCKTLKNYQIYYMLNNQL